MEKLKMHSLDNVDENIKKIGKLFPNCLTEKKNNNGEIEYAIDFDKLKQELSDEIVEGNQERYQFTWPDKKKSMLLANTPIAKTLRPYKEESVDFDTTENLYIEGDNLEVLKLLQETYLGKIDMIYIDPPYNTGNDFVYDDNFSQKNSDYLENSGQFDDEGNRLVKNLESNGRFHTDWLNMIYPRLKVAKNLLNNDGKIFISIDEKEISNMQKICNEIFGEKNYAATFIWTKTSTPPSLSYKCRKTVEYVLVYEKNLNDYKYFGEILDGGDVPLLNTGNPIKTLVFPPHSVKFSFLSEGIIYKGPKEKLNIEEDILIKNYWNANSIKLTGQFKWTQDKLNKEIKAKTYFLIKSNKFSIRFQRANLENFYKTPNNFINIELNKQNGVGTNEIAIKEQKLLELDKVFDYPKPISLVKKLINMSCKQKKDFNILDFFSGSATTAHAVMEINKKDKRNIKFLLVQLPEQTDKKSEAYKLGYNTICEIGKERIRRAGKKIKEESPLTTQDLDIGFRVLKCDSTNMKDVYYKPEEYEDDLFDSLTNNIKEDRTSEDLLFQVMLDLGILLSSKIEENIIDNKKIFNVADGYLLACFDDNITEEIIIEIAKQKPYYFVMRDSSLAGDNVLTNFDQIFNTYSPDTIRKVI